MPLRDIEQPDDAQIEAALREAIDRPLEQLLSIAEFAEKCDLADEPAEFDDATEPAETPDVIALPESVYLPPSEEVRRAA